MNSEKIRQFFKDNKNMSNIFIILIIGVIILLFGSSFFGASQKKQTAITTEVKTTKSKSYEENLESRLADTLSRLEGVGNIAVMISFEKSEEIYPVYDKKSIETVTGEEDSAGGKRTTTEKNEEQTAVKIQKSSGYDEVVTAYRSSPKPIGVIVIAEGAEVPSVKSNITEAVKAVISVPAHRIQVFNSDKGKKIKSLQ